MRPSGVPKITVSKGTKVKWRFGTGNPHNVTVKSRARRSSAPACKQLRHATRKKLKKRGTYTIYCTIHGFSDQRMKLVVK